MVEGKQYPSILLLGAGHDQLFAIHTAKQMGYEVLVVDVDPNAPGFALADDHAVISTRDIPGIVGFIEEYMSKGKSVDGVAVMGSDIPDVVASIASYLGTPSVGLESARLTIDKYEMKRHLRAKGIPVPSFSRVGSPDEVRKAVEEFGLPVIIKPVDRSGARGVFLVRHEDEVDRLYEEALESSFSKVVMVEEYVPGPQISTETIMFKGKGITPGFADRNYEYLDRFSPHIIENGGTVPSSVDGKTRTAVEQLVERTALAAGIVDGVVKSDIVIGKKGPIVIEIAARLSGGDFSESLIPLGCGVNLVKTALSMATGKNPDLEELRPKFTRAVLNRYFFPEPGRLVRIQGVEAVRQQPWVKKLEFWYRPGDIVSVVRSHADRFGVFIVIADTRSEALERARWVYDRIRIVTEPVR